MRSKARRAAEYLIVLTVVVIAVFAVLQVIGGVASRSVSWENAPVAITSYAIDADGNVLLNLRNNQQGSITLTSISFVTELSVNTVNSTSTLLEAGATKSFKGTQLGTCSKAGEDYSYGAYIQYTDPSTGAAYTENANGAELEGTCAS